MLNPHVMAETDFPVVQAMCTEDGQEVLQETLEMISYFIICKTLETCLGHLLYTWLAGESI